MFIYDFYDGRLTKVYKSEPVYDENEETDSPFTILVGDNFNKVTQNPDKDVLVYFWESHCDHCEKLEPVVKRIAKRVKLIDDLIVSKFNCDKNEVKGL
jgi:protein disulfide-isomerase A1